MKTFVKKIYKDSIAICVMLVLTGMFTMQFMDLEQFDLRYPISYDGGDGMSYLVNAVMLMESNTTMESDRMGAPYGYYGYDFYASSLHNFDNWLMKAVVLFTDDAAVAVNILFLMLFPMIALSGYFVLRQMNIRPWVSVGGALTYAFMPYIFMRGVNHFVLASYYFVPISLLYCVWIYTDDTFMCFDRSFFTNWKNYFAILLSFCIANNGISYYPFFTCFFLVVTGIVKALQQKKMRYFGKAAVLIVLVAGFMVVALIPNIRYIHANGSNEDAVVRTVDGVETYALKIAQMFLPITSHGVEKIGEWVEEYEDNMPLVNENSMVYLGVMGCVGFLVLLVVLFLRHIREDRLATQQLSMLSVLNIAGVLLGTIGGFGSLFGLMITDMIRCYNRISIFLAFIDIAAVCILLDMLSEKLLAGLGAAQRLKPALRQGIYILYAAAVCGVIWGGIEFQYPGQTIDYETFRESYDSDRSFVQEIERSLPEGSLIYQLPYHEYPEGGYVEKMADYDLWTGFIHSKTLRWSYGGVVGRESDLWLASIDNSDIPKMLAAVTEKGFRGIYIDRRAYTDEELLDLEWGLEQQLGTEPVRSANSALSFFYINN